MNWWYQLQGPVTQKADIVVMDLDADPVVGSEVWGYLSIGEAEDYRSYWPSLPKHLVLGSNPSWPGNYSVKFWDDYWMDLMLDKVRNIPKGWTGVYLDKADVIWDIKTPYEDALTEAMIEFILALTRERPDLKFCLQNAEQLLKNADLRAALYAVAAEQLAEEPYRLEQYKLFTGLKLEVEYDRSMPFIAGWVGIYRDVELGPV